MHEEPVTIVSGLPRSGTSMMMKMLEAGGMEVLTDNVRKPDKDNPQGYYEFERVKQIEHDQVWLEDARGKVVKMISQLLKHLPRGYVYKVIFMRRDMDEILASQRKMLVRRGEATDRVDDETMAALFRKHLRHVETWLEEQPNFELLYANYNDIVKNPLRQAQRVDRFFDEALDVEAMATVVDPNLYRQRADS